MEIANPILIFLAIFAAIGLLYCFVKFVNFLIKFFSLFSCCSYNLPRRYGEGSYALVTGASDGIGKGFCIELARQGFNICMLVRNKAKAEKAASEISLLNPKIAIKIIIADFVEGYKADFYTHIFEQIKDLDISILVNNAGLDSNKKWINLSDEEVLGVSIVNMLPVQIITKKLIPHMLKRNSKSAVISISSVAGVWPQTYAEHYSASKAYIDYFMRICQADDFTNIDFLSARVCFVATNMFREQPSSDVISAEECATGILADLGKRSLTYGHWKHKLEGYFYELTPFCLYNCIYKKYYADRVLNATGANFQESDKKRVSPEINAQLPKTI